MLVNAEHVFIPQMEHRLPPMVLGYSGTLRDKTGATWKSPLTIPKGFDWFKRLHISSGLAAGSQYKAFPLNGTVLSGRQKLNRIGRSFHLDLPVSWAPALSQGQAPVSRRLYLKLTPLGPVSADESLKLFGYRYNKNNETSSWKKKLGVEVEKWR